jgi:hypothetical protein
MFEMISRKQKAIDQFGRIKFKLRSAEEFSIPRDWLPHLKNYQASLKV